jgi:hypothetical protein
MSSPMQPIIHIFFMIASVSYADRIKLIEKMYRISINESERATQIEVTLHDFTCILDSLCNRTETERDVSSVNCLKTLN